MTDKPVAPDLDQQLKQVQAISQNARTTWFGLIALNLFVGVTVMAHRDLDFFARDAATTLPLLNIDVPVVAFFIAAPLLVTAIHVYLQVYLVSLWTALAQLPPRDNGTPMADRVFPWLMAHAALRQRARLRGGEKEHPAEPPRPMGWLVEWVSAALGWLLPLAMLTGLWLRSAPLHNPWLTGWIALCLLVSALVAAAGYLAMRRAMAGNGDHASPNAWLLIWGTVAASVLTCATLETTFATNGLRWPDRSEERSEGMPGWLPSHADIVALLPGRARLAEVRLTDRPADWKPFQLWLEDQRRANAGKDDRWDDPKQDPLIPNAHEMQRWRLLIATLNAPDLRARDLREANAFGAFLPGADLRNADLRRADLRSARMEGADLGGARMEGADLFGARMEGADLGGARMEGADLRGARMGGSDCTSAAFLAALVQSADLTCRNLTRAQLQFTVGDPRTRLPAGMMVWSCLDRDGFSEDARARIDAILQRYPEEDHPSGGPVARSRYAAVLFCDRTSANLYKKDQLPMPAPIAGQPH